MLAKAAGDADLARQVAEHKTLFFKVSTPDGPLDYQKAMSGDLKLVPTDDQALSILEGDYHAMVEARLPQGENAPTFGVLMASCRKIADEINATT
ncbi:hypothetical protein [Sphingobium yanoikuyae]|uniref:hypothetical protein n=1 Tax=Sphingobium yanoikuyae TaxID=13690 RepID=UPI00241DC442|nr:hypothetical protein [Sphingobium yanoikuyae]